MVGDPIQTMKIVMIFQSEQARQFLLDYGFVHSFRVKPRRNIGKGWVTDRRGGSKIMDVQISLVGEKRLDELQQYVKTSGFSSVSQWIEEIQRLNRNQLPKKGFVYLVKAVKCPNCERIPHTWFMFNIDGKPRVYTVPHYVCEDPCNSMFVWNKTKQQCVLVEQSKQEETPDEPSICPSCNEDFNTLSMMIINKKLTVVYLCKNCGTTFYGSENEKRHITLKLSY